MTLACSSMSLQLPRHPHLFQAIVDTDIPQNLPHARKQTYSSLARDLLLSGASKEHVTVPSTKLSAT